jgi:TRAP-type C4-dicarboxylate transport system permease large subunit
MVFFILLGSLTFAQILAFSGTTNGLINWATSFNLSPTSMVLIMFGILVILGCFVDAISMLLITLPVFMPLAKAVGYDPVWFGVVMMVSIVLGGLSPPFGLTLFVMMGVAPADTRFGEVVRAGLPYFFAGVVLFVLLVLWPQLALYLPSLMAG